MENQFLFDVDFQELSPSARFLYLLIKVLQRDKLLLSIHVDDLSRLSGFSTDEVAGLMREINVEFDIYTLLDVNDYIVHAI